MTTLCVNVDHVATLREARKATFPDPVEAARIAESAGAAGITIHLRSDRRHVQERDLERLRESVRGKLNLEIAASDDMVAIACRHLPDQVSLVPERPDEVTTEGGLDVVAHERRVIAAAERLGEAGISVSVFVDPDPRQIERLAGLPKGLVSGFEINTDTYTRAVGDEAAAELAQVAEAATRGAGHGLAVFAGHGLTVANVGPVARLREVEELNIGHSIVARAVIVGMERAVGEMLAAIG